MAPPAAWATFAVQIAKSFGAEVTGGLQYSQGGKWCARWGPIQIIDYTKDDFTKEWQKYDLILAVNGFHPIAAYKRALTPKGIYVMAGGSVAQIFQAMLLGARMSENGGRKLGSMLAKITQKGPGGADGPYSRRAKLSPSSTGPFH